MSFQSRQCRNVSFGLGVTIPDCWFSCKVQTYMFEELLCKYTHSLVRALIKTHRITCFISLKKKEKTLRAAVQALSEFNWSCTKEYTEQRRCLLLSEFSGVKKGTRSCTRAKEEWGLEPSTLEYLINTMSNFTHFFFFFKRSYLCSGLIGGRTLNSTYNTDLNQSKSEEYITGWTCTEHTLVATTNDAQCSSLFACLGKHFPKLHKKMYL